MKKLLTAALAAAVLMVTLGGAVLAEPRLPSDADAQPDTSYEAGSAPAQTDAWTAMQPAIHALVLAMDENDLDYTPDDPRFQWVALYYMLSLYGRMDDRAELSDAYLTLPGEAVMDLAIPMFPQLTGLPQLPAIPAGSSLGRWCIWRRARCCTPSASSWRRTTPCSASPSPA